MHDDLQKLLQSLQEANTGQQTMIQGLLTMSQQQHQGLLTMSQRQQNAFLGVMGRLAGRLEAFANCQQQRLALESSRTERVLAIEERRVKLSESRADGGLP